MSGEVLAVVGLMRERARGGDPLVEDNVRVWTEEPAQTAEFLGAPGVESCLLELLSNLSGSKIVILGEVVEVEYRTCP